MLVHSNEFWWAPHAIRTGQLLNIPLVVHLRSDLHDLKQARQYHLATATGGIRDAIPDPSYGSIVPTEDQAALAGEIARFMTNPKLREQTADAARIRARDMFTLARYRERLLEVYEACLSARSARH